MIDELGFEFDIGDEFHVLEKMSLVLRPELFNISKASVIHFLVLTTFSGPLQQRTA